MASLQSFETNCGIELKETKECGQGFFVTKSQISAGTVIWNESPIVHCLQSNVCHYCWTQPTSSSSLSRCSGCKLARYCSKKCQSTDWKQTHKLRCKAIQKLNTKTPPTCTVVCVAELLHEQSLNPPSSSSSPMKALQMSLIDKMSHHSGQRSEDQLSNLQQVSLCIALYLRALQQTNACVQLRQPSLDVIRGRLAQFTINAISICDDEFREFGIGFFPLISKLNHSCDPNVVIRFNPFTRTAEVRALREIHASEQLFISYIDATLPWFQRQSMLKRNYFFNCRCSFCCHAEEKEALCLVLQCKKYDQQTLCAMVDSAETEYRAIADAVRGSPSRDDLVSLLQRCQNCLCGISDVVGPQHWLNIAVYKIIEKLQSQLNDYHNCCLSNQKILQSYEQWLSGDSPYLGMQYCLTAKLLNCVVHDECQKIYGVQTGGQKGDKKVMKKRELLELCHTACKYFTKGITIVSVSHGRDTPFVKDLMLCHQTAVLNLQNVCRNE